MKSIKVAVPFLLAFLLYSCCEPEFKNSSPYVMYDTYVDTFVYDRFPESFLTDSGWYPIYSFRVQNIGTDPDTFEMTIGKDGWGFRMKKYIEGGQTVVFRTPGPLPDTADPSAQELYFSFFRHDTALLPIQIMQPFISFKYGEVYKSDEGCNTEPSELQVDTRLFR